jgi:PadR family transcriptional regulator PadR
MQSDVPANESPRPSGASKGSPRKTGMDPMAAVAAWNTQLRKGLLELCVLALLRRREEYGYGVVAALAAQPALEASESTVYPLLARLLRERHLAVRKAPSRLGPPRRYYRLTSSGASRLALLSRAWREAAAAVGALIPGEDDDRRDGLGTEAASSP